MSINPVSLVRHTMLHVKCAKLRRFLRQGERASQIQRESILKRVAANAESRFGRDHGFAHIRSIDEFRNQVPIGGYERHREYIEDVMRGDVGAMFQPDSKILMFATTSGTTDKPKMLPVTEEFYRQYKASWQYWGTGVYRDYPELFRYKTLQFSSRYDVDFSPSGIPCGNISGLAAETRPFYISSLFILPPSVIKVGGHVAKHYTALRLSLASDKIGMMITANPSTLIEVAKLADQRKEELIRDIHDGTLNKEIEVPSDIRAALRGRLGSNPSRARHLERLAEQHDGLYPKHAWPNLRLIAVWTGGSVGVYLKQLPKFYGDVPIRDHGISASEGRMTIPLANGVADGILDYASHYYEFIPEAEHGQANPTVLEAHQLTPGENYYILLSTSAGLYRYDIHDLVHCHGYQCEGYQGEAPMLSFLNKGKNFSSLTGEKLSEHQINSAVREALSRLSEEGFTFTVAPTMENGKVRYHMFIPNSNAKRIGKQLAQEFQTQLEKVNMEYADKCRSGRILELEVTGVPEAFFQQMRIEKSQARGNFEEYKHPMLTGDLDFAIRAQQAIQAEEVNQPPSTTHPSTTHQG